MNTSTSILINIGGIAFSVVILTVIQGIIQPWLWERIKQFRLWGYLKYSHANPRMWGIIDKLTYEDQFYEHYADREGDDPILTAHREPAEYHVPNK